MRFDTTHHVPSYQNWLEAQGHTGAYRFHKRFLQHLQFQSGRGRWVLKCPDHVFAFDAIDAIYPDARFVFVHRNPLSVLPSVAKLTALLRRPFTRELHPGAIGRQVTERWAQGARLIIERCKRSRKPDRIFHVHYDELTAKPLEVVAALYDRFGLEFSGPAYRKMADFIQHTPRGGYGSNRYSFEEFDLNRKICTSASRNICRISTSPAVRRLIGKIRRWKLHECSCGRRFHRWHSYFGRLGRVRRGRPPSCTPPHRWDSPGSD
jgi:hypothetical protein